MDANYKGGRFELLDTIRLKKERKKTNNSFTQFHSRWSPLVSKIHIYILKRN